MEGMAKKKPSEKSNISDIEEFANKAFDMLVKENLINPQNYAVEDLKLLVSELLIEINRRLKITK